MSQIINLTLRHLKEVGIEQHIPNITEENAEFLKNLIRKKNPKHLLEIGTANGYSTLHFATAISETSDITTLEKAWNMHNFAVENFKTCKIKNIHALWCDANQAIPILADEFFDFVYIDAMKKEYLNYLLLALPKMTSDALIVIDDVEKFADKMVDFYTFLSEKSIPYTLEKTDTDDSIMLIQRSDIVL
jgi:predicted O-methyltransferase YrrM